VAVRKARGGLDSRHAAAIREDLRANLVRIRSVLAAIEAVTSGAGAGAVVAESMGQ
jgi:hypothetical protein